MVNSHGLTFPINNTVSRYMHPVILALCDFRRRVSKLNLTLVTLRRVFKIVGIQTRDLSTVIRPILFRSTQ